MTTVAAVQVKNDVEFAFDSMVSAGNSKYPNSFEKVFRNGPVVFGIAGAVRAANILRFMSVPELSVKGTEVDRWVVRSFIPAFQEALTDAKAALDESGEQSVHGSFLIAVAGRAYELSGDFSVFRSGSGRYAIGSGSQFAAGALAQGATPIEAVRVAADLDAYTGGRIRTVLASGVK